MDQFAAKIRIITATIILFCVVLLVSMLWSRSTPLSTHDQTLLLSRVNRFADRYDPSLSAQERSEVASNARLSSHPPFPIENLLLLSVLGVSLSFVFVSSTPLLYLGYQVGREEGLRSIPRPFLVLAACLAVAIITSAFLGWKVLAVSSDFAGSGGFVSDNRVFLQREHRNELRNDDELINIFDHELTHFFGEESLEKISRDSWLAYAYSAVFALERGGIETFERETRLFLNFTPTARYCFYRGIIIAASTFPSQDAESEFQKLTLLAPINPDVKGDGSESPGADTNRAFDFGLAGIAWYLSGGHADIALTYLDDRSHGLSAAQATDHAMRSIDLRGLKFRSTCMGTQGELFHIAESYMYVIRRETTQNHLK